jgi:SAM-dependent methyltransferase
MRIGDKLQNLIDNYSKARNTLTILEAGCGSLSHINVPSNAYVVGVDISQRQLDRNDVVHEKILADIQTCRLPAASFDIIICWDVLEHLNNPSKAVSAFFDACKEEGIIILAFPNLYSLKGVITKLTPHRVHLWFYRLLLGNKQAGAEDLGPFPTPFRLAVTHSAIRKSAKSYNSTVEFFMAYEDNITLFLRQKSPLLSATFNIASGLTRMLSFRTIDAMHSECIMVLKKGR